MSLKSWMIFFRESYCPILYKINKWHLIKSEVKEQQSVISYVYFLIKNLSVVMAAQSG